MICTAKNVPSVAKQSASLVPSARGNLVPNEPTNKALYSRVKSEAKRKFNAFPSAYASAWIVRTYKKRGGKYKTVKKSGKK